MLDTRYVSVANVPDLWEHGSGLGGGILVVDRAEHGGDTGAPVFAVLFHRGPAGKGVIAIAVETEVDDVGAVEQDTICPGRVIRSGEGAIDVAETEIPAYDALVQEGDVDFLPQGNPDGGLAESCGRMGGGVLRGDQDFGADKVRLQIET